MEVESTKLPEFRSMQVVSATGVVAHVAWRRRAKGAAELVGSNRNEDAGTSSIAQTFWVLPKDTHDIV